MFIFLLTLACASVGLCLTLGLYYLRLKTKYIRLLGDYEELKAKHTLNPSYETQTMMAELLSGHNLFRIERIDTQDIYLRRR